MAALRREFLATYPLVLADRDRSATDRWPCAADARVVPFADGRERLLLGNLLACFVV